MSPRGDRLRAFAHDRGVEVTTAPLQSAEAVWSPSERLIIVASRLRGDAYDAALEHELHHVLGDDTHLLLDGEVPTHGQRLMARAPDWMRRQWRWWLLGTAVLVVAVAGAVAAGTAAVLPNIGSDVAEVDDPAPTSSPSRTSSATPVPGTATAAHPPATSRTVPPGGKTGTSAGGLPAPNETAPTAPRNPGGVAGPKPTVPAPDPGRAPTPAPAPASPEPAGEPGSSPTPTPESTALLCRILGVLVPCP